MNRPPSPETSPPVEGVIDPELVSLPRPPQTGKTLSLALMSLTAFFAIVLSAGLFGDVRYALSNAEADDIGPMTSLAPGPAVSNRFVKTKGALDRSTAVRYDRVLESGAFEIAKVAGNPKIWVEMRVPDGEGPNFALPATTFVGRLVPLDSVEFRLRSFWMPSRSAYAAGEWVLLDGATPASFHWSLPLFALLVVFAGYNLAMIGRIVRPVR
ncbi:MAG TPA: hypothetical protein VGL13_03525 [Polyangiaceae bacterium]|jgi:hypothetical protein